MAASKLTLPVDPPILPDESFSSWLQRIARIYGTSPAGFVSALACEANVPHQWYLSRWANEGDNPPALVLQTVAKRAGLPSGILERTTVASLYRELALGDNKSKGSRARNWPFVSRWAHAWCPRCLASKPRYLRLVWQLEAALACVPHRIGLCDRCPGCGGKLLEPPVVGEDIVACPRCGADLALGKAVPATAAGLLVSVVVQSRTSVLVLQSESRKVQLCDLLGFVLCLRQFLEDLMRRGPSDLLEGPTGRLNKFLRATVPTLRRHSVLLAPSGTVRMAWFAELLMWLLEDCEDRMRTLDQKLDFDARDGLRAVNLPPPSKACRR